MTVSLSVFIITRDEALTIRDCLESVSWADEIVVLDSGSSDDTVAIAKTLTDKVFTDTDWQGYGIQKQRAQDKTSGDWVLSIDADERVTPELKAEIQSVLSENDQGKVYAVPILPNCFGKFIRHGGWYPARKVRLYPRLLARYGDQWVHEKLTYQQTPQVVNLNADLRHYTYRDMEHYLVKSARYAAEWAEQRYQQGKRTSLTTAFLHGVGCFLKIYIARAGFLDGRHGLLIALLSAHSTFVKYADLWARHYRNK